VLVHSTPLLYQGAWAERFLAPEAHVAAKPSTLSWGEAALLPVPLLSLPGSSCRSWPRPVERCSSMAGAA
jgi:hypothetical protein